jgi:Ca2+/Na+ antiporter
MEYTSRRDFFSFRGDALGIFLSGACLVHCVILPLFYFASPILTNFSENEWVHIGLLTMLFPIALITFLSGKKNHKSSKPFIWGSIGIVFLASSVFLEEIFILDVKLELLLTIVGSLLICYAHYLNISLKKEHGCYSIR